MKVYLDKYKHPTIPEVYDNSADILSPYEAENIDYIYEQILYRNKLLLDADGETFQIWRKKRQGMQCDNPDCGASQNLNGTPNASCPRCLGTGYIGGFDYAGETLIRIAPTGLLFTVSPSGAMKAHNPRSWTFPEPLILSMDILIAVDQDRLVSEKRIIDESVARRVDLTTDFDSLVNTGIVKILKISDGVNANEAYQQNIDYVLSNDGILWLTGGGARRPGDMESYYVTYIIATSYMRRYEVSEVTRSTWRGKILHQDITLNELELSHVAYTNIIAETWDDTRYNYPFPYSNWFDRTI